MNPMDLRRGINKAVDIVVEELKKMSTQVTNNDQLAHVATISANNDREIGQLIADLFAKVGKTGAITVEEGKTLKHEIGFVEGLKFDRGFMSPYFATNQKTGICEFENPLILIANTKIGNVQTVYKFLEHAAQANKPLVIIAEDVESEPLAALILNKLKGVLRVACVKTPGFGNNRKNQLDDIGVLTKSEVIDTDMGMSFENVDINILGSAKKVIINKDETIIIDGSGEKEVIKGRVE